MVDVGFRAPAFDAPVDLEAHVAMLPANATSKGMFFTALFERASSRISRAALAKKAGIADRSYLAFGDYSMADNMRLTVAVAGVLFPMKPLGHALRELGGGAFEAFLGSHLGRTMLAVFDADPSSLLRVAPKVYAALFNFGAIEHHRIALGHDRVIVRQMPIFIETFQVGAAESVLRYTRSAGRIELRMDSIADATVDVHWQRAE